MRARTLANLDEPAVAVGVHCGAPHGCEFYAHCAPPGGEVFRARLGRQQGKALRADALQAMPILRDVPETELKNDLQRRIWQQSRLEKPYVGAELRDARRLAAVPALLPRLRNRGTRRADLRGHAAVRGAAVSMVVPHRDRAAAAWSTPSFSTSAPTPPMRRLAESLLATLGTTGPILVYTPYERRVLEGPRGALSPISPPDSRRSTSASSTCTPPRGATTTTPRCRARGRSKPCCRPSHPI